MTTECWDCSLNQAAVEMPCVVHCPEDQRPERDRRYALVIAGLPCGMRREELRKRGEWSAW